MLDTTKKIKRVTYEGVDFPFESVGGSPKFASLISGTITTIDENDLSEVTIIRAGVFAGLPLVSVTIPSNVTEIGANAFSECNSLQVLNLTEGLQKIGEGAFSGIDVYDLTIPESVTEIGANAFEGSSVSQIYVTNFTPPTIGENAFPTRLSIYVPYGAYDAYVSSWSAYASKIVRLPAKPSTITVTVNNYLGELVSGASVTITGNGQTYTGTTDSVGVFSQGDLQPATYTISVADLEGFKTPDVQEVVVEEDTQNSVIVTYLEKPALMPVYGVSWVNDASTTMTRTDDAVGMAYSIDTSTGKITSDFDSVFPYNQMKRQVIGGNTFVYIPAMWFRVIADSDKKITSIAVSETQGEGDNWYQTRPFYYGAYGASSNGSVLKSVSGATRLGNITRAVARQRARAVGTGYHQRDLYSGTILMFLWWIEFANKNSSNIRSGAEYGKKTGNTDLIYNEEEGANFCVSGSVTSTSQMVWHGIEDYIGNGCEWEDGITGNGTEGGTQYVSDDYTLYDDYSSTSKMSALSYNSPATTYKCLTALGWDETKPFLCQPIDARNDTGYYSGFCDEISVSNNIVSFRGSERPSYSGGGVSHFDRANVSFKYESVCCRLVLNA